MSGCAQCGRDHAGLRLDSETRRCSVCRQKTAKHVWLAQRKKEREAAQVQAIGPRDCLLDVFGTAEMPKQITTRLLTIREAEALLNMVQRSIDASQVKRVEKMGERIVLERYQDMETGGKITRLTIREQE